jgi:hypothetical protein
MLTKITKTLLAALVLAGVSTALVSNASALPVRGWNQGQDGYMQDRHNPADTNGY